MSSPEVQDDFLKRLLLFFFFFSFFFFTLPFHGGAVDSDIILIAGELVLTELDHFTVSSSYDRDLAFSVAAQ